MAPDAAVAGTPIPGCNITMVRNERNKELMTFCNDAKGRTWESKVASQQKSI
jgi:hypothetical protein